MKYCFTITFITLALNCQSIIEKNISYKTHDGCPINGMITMPRNKTNQSNPGIVLIHGSAPVDMDSTWPPELNGVPQTFNGKMMKPFKKYEILVTL
jgi:dipeptidyl aminopeptidase/acylaminoacyl peptidase